MGGFTCIAHHMGSTAVSGLGNRAVGQGVATMRFEGKTALITGAARGIGRAVALRLAREGADVTVNDLNTASVEAVAAEVEALGRKALGVTADVTNSAAVEEMVARHQDAFGRLDILVNNAGIIIVKPMMENTEEDWDRIFAVNVKSIFFCSRAAAPIMMAQKSGKIINTASAASYLASPYQAAYCVTKAAVISLTQSLAKELAQHNIQVNSVCPGIIDTDMWAQIDREAGAMDGSTEPGQFMSERIERLVASGRPGSSDEVAAVFAFLASADADYVTGQSYGVDGGLLFR